MLLYWLDVDGMQAIEAIYNGGGLLPELPPIPFNIKVKSVTPFTGVRGVRPPEGELTPSP